MHGAIFDMDGLLIDSEKLWQRTWYEIAGEMGLTLADSFPTDMCGTGGAQTRAVVARHYHTDDPESIVRECSQRMYRIEREQGVPLKPGVRTILEGMRAAGWRIAVASSSPMDMIQNNLRRSGIAEYFDALTSGAEVERNKPEPDVFLLAARKLGVPPEDCFVFEDSINGVEAGWRAGCRAVMVPDMVQPNEHARQMSVCICRDLTEAWEKVKAQTGAGVDRPQGKEKEK